MAIADQRVSAQASVFYMRRTDQQVSGSVQYDPEDPLYIRPADGQRGARRKFRPRVGANWQASGLPSDRCDPGSAARQFLDYALGDSTLEGRDQPFAPRYQAGLTLDWHNTRGFFARADFHAVDGYFFSASHDERNEPYQLLNLRIGYDAVKWSVSLWASNLLDEHYATHGFFFNLEPPDYPAKRYIQNGDPRQIGMRVSFSL